MLFLSVQFNHAGRQEKENGDTIVRSGQRVAVPRSDVGRDHFWNQQIAAQERGR